MPQECIGRPAVGVEAWGIALPRRASGRAAPSPYRPEASPIPVQGPPWRGKVVPEGDGNGPCYNGGGTCPLPVEPAVEASGTRRVAPESLLAPSPAGPRDLRAPEGTERVGRSAVFGTDPVRGTLVA
jgi:hypothetical protein